MSAIHPATAARLRIIRDIVARWDEERQDQGLTREQWAKRSGVSEGVIAYAINGGHDLKVETVLRLAAGLGWGVRVQTGPRRSGAPGCLGGGA